MSDIAVIEMEKAICYLRVSTEEQARFGVSFANQEEKLLAYCKMQGLEVLDIIREEGVSGAKELYTRPGGSLARSYLRSGKASHIVAITLDRLFRDAADALKMTREWDRTGVTMNIVDMGGISINSKSAVGRMFLTIVASFAEFERNLIAERTSNALQHKKSNLEVYGETPFGYDRDGGNLKINTAEREILMQIKSMRERGETLRAIAEELNNAGVPTKTSAKKCSRWYASTIHRILNNDIHAEVFCKCLMTKNNY